MNQHLNGYGNGDVYADFKSGDDFGVKLLSLTNSNFYSLDDLERNMIEYHNAYQRGYK